MQTKTSTSKTNNLKDFLSMASSQDYHSGIYGGGWWNPGRSLFSPCSAALSDFMWLDSSLNDVDEQADQMKQVTAAASYSRSDESSDDHHSSSTDQHLHVMSSDYVQQTFEHGHKPQVCDFSISDWSVNNNNHGFCNQNQFDTTAKEYQMGLENIASYGYPAAIQTLATGPDSSDVMSCVFENIFAPNLPKLMMSPSPKQQLNYGTKNTNTNNSMPFWDSWMGNDVVDVPDSHQLLSTALTEDHKPYNLGCSTRGVGLISPSKVASKDMIAHKVASDSTLLGTKKKNNTTSDEMYKRPRFETPSSLPTFKVRKEKLGDRITALQQLVSPFGKTDTASVLHEAIEYIKFLHDQVLRTPYMQNGTPTNQHQQMQGELKTTGSEFPKQDLKSRGLCLVPISSTFPVANETTADFWTPTFGGTVTLR